MARPDAESFRTARLPGWSRRHLLAACAGLALLAGCAPAALAEGRLVQVDIVDRDTGRPLPVYRDHGRAWVAGRPGARYAVRVDNRSGERVMVVVSIDGVNIMTGETASVDQDGYVLNPWQDALLTGWRKSHSEVAAFEFTRLPDTYAARTGRPDNVGAIGVAVFRERPPQVLREAVPPRRLEAPRRPAPDDRSEASPPPVAAPAPNVAAAPATTKPAPSARPADRLPAGTAAADTESARGDERRKVEPGERIGTGHGDRETSWVVDTTFDRLSARPAEIVRFHYDSLANLVAAGIAPAPSPYPVAQARPFPGDDDRRFVPDPPSR